VWSADGDVAPDELGRVHVGIAGAVVAPVHPQHRLLHLRAPDDATAANREGKLRGRVHVGIVVVREGGAVVTYSFIFYSFWRKCSRKLRTNVTYFSPETNILGANEIYQCRGNAQLLLHYEIQRVNLFNPIAKKTPNHRDVR
jgi:hypothetical protein